MSISIPMCRVQKREDKVVAEGIFSTSGGKGVDKYLQAQPCKLKCKGKWILQLIIISWVSFYLSQWYSVGINKMSDYGGLS